MLQRFDCIDKSHCSSLKCCSHAQEAKRNSRVAAAVFAAHRLALETDAASKSETARLLDDSSCLHTTPDPDELALEFEQQLHEKVATASPAEAFSIRERTSSRRSRADRCVATPSHQ